MDAISAKEIQALMRRHKKTIATLAHTMNITQRRVRFVRLHGIRGVAYCKDWEEAITSKSP